MHSSQNEQDSRHYAKAAKVPMLEPADSAEALAFTKLAYELSEQFDTPVFLKMCTRVSHSQSVVEPGERAALPEKPYEKNGAKYIMMPGNAKRRHPIVEQRTADLTAWAETAAINRIEEGTDKSIGIVTSSTSYQYVKEACGDKYPVLKLGMIWPMPEQKIRDFAAGVDKLVSWRNSTALSRSTAATWAWIRLARLYSAALTSSARTSLPKSWASCRTRAPRSTKPSGPPAGDVRRLPAPRPVLHACQKQADRSGRTSAAIRSARCRRSRQSTRRSAWAHRFSGLHGFLKAGGPGAEGKSVAVIGDSTFMHSGITGLVNIAYNESMRRSSSWTTRSPA